VGHETLDGMKQADLDLGSEYAYQTYEPYDAAPIAARVRIVSIDGDGKATVHVLDPGPKPSKHAYGARQVKRNEKLQVNTRHIICRWEEWADRASMIQAEKQSRTAAQRAQREAHEQEQADRLAIKADRTLPETYDEKYFYSDVDTEERAALCKAYIPARGLGPYATVDEIKPLLVDLPILVLRDILATDKHGRPGTDGTVAGTYMRAAELLERARITSMRSVRGYETPRAGALLGEVDTAFVNAVREHVSASGGELLLPPVPPLPEWIDEDERAVAEIFGWLRLAIGDTNGRLLHSPGCSSLSSSQLLLSDHAPWWQVALQNLRFCGRCGGPGVRDLIQLAGFTAAADVWHARGRDRIEGWQQAAVQRLLVATAAARVKILEPDITLTWRIVAALAENRPSEEGWDAYALAAATSWNRLDKDFQELTPERRRAAHALAHERLTTLESALPRSQRSTPLPSTADTATLRDRYAHLKRLLDDEVPQLDRLLFTLPSAT
jgi:hypothetical protein